MTVTKQENEPIHNNNGHDTADTSVEALQDVPTNKRQMQVKNALEEIQPASNRMIAQHLGWDVNRVTGRVRELREAGVVVFDSKRECEVANHDRAVRYWRVNDDD